MIDERRSLNLYSHYHRAASNVTEPKERRCIRSLAAGRWRRNESSKIYALTVISWRANKNRIATANRVVSAYILIFESIKFNASTRRCRVYIFLCGNVWQLVRGLFFTVICLDLARRANFNRRRRKGNLLSSGSGVFEKSVLPIEKGVEIEFQLMCYFCFICSMRNTWKEESAWEEEEVTWWLHHIES